MIENKVGELGRPSVAYPLLGTETREQLQRVMAAYDNIPVSPSMRFRIQSNAMLWVIDFTSPETLSR